MIVITVARKPLSTGTVATNVLAHGCGAMNVDECRIGNWQTRLDTACNKGDTGQARFNTLGSVNTTGYTKSEVKNGRWPANLVLGHMDGCRQEGTRNVRSNGHYPAARGRGSGVSGPAWHGGQDGLQERHMDGETVAAWSCVDGCPVAELDAQSGISQSSVGTQKYKRADTSGWVERGGSFTPGREWNAEGYGDVGGASRYFKQVGGSK